ncbi:NUDIX domain-containing protein [Candidatus Nomurabacteria bacterium]|nr:NUDIX domain-containing protein [Candidatus Nomurabacteria bacterium]
MISYKTTIKDAEVTFTRVGVKNVPPFSKVTSVSVIPITETGEMIAVRLKNRGLDIPGGHVEKHEKSPEETLHRELMEEANVTVKDIKLAEVIRSNYFGDAVEDASYMLIYVAKVDEILDFTLSYEMSYERVIISPEEFIRNYSAGDQDFMHDIIKQAYKNLKT